MIQNVFEGVIMNKIGIQELLDIGIQREEEAHEFYKFAAGQTKDILIQNLFTELSSEELEHKGLLLRFKNDPQLIKKLKVPEKEFIMAESVDLPDLTDDMKPADALALAMKKEQLAAEYYQKLAAEFIDKEAKEICLIMANMELHHKNRLENAYTEVTYIEDF